MDLEIVDLNKRVVENITPFVSIWMLTYNQEKFIEQCVESVMNQQANFEYKLFIGEDVSTDNTREICKRLKKKFPNKIELFLNDRNLGVNLNAKKVLEETFNSNAKYIALLEGDDYWTDPYKLQKQVDFLELNQDYIGVAHRHHILYQNYTKKKYVSRGTLLNFYFIYLVLFLAEFISLYKLKVFHVEHSLFL